MSTVLEEQIQQLSHKNFKTAFWAGLKDGTTPDHDAAASWLGAHKSSMDKAIADFENAIKAYLALNTQLRANAAEPEVLSKAEKIEKSVAVLEASLTHLLHNVKWPNPTKCKGAIEQELASLKTINTKIETLVRKSSGAVDKLAVDGEGKSMTSRQVPTPGKNHEDMQTTRQNYEKAKILLKAYEVARSAAIAAKVSYTNAKLAAKTKLGEYEEFLKKTNPEYHLKTIDWNDEKAWEKVSADPALLAALQDLQAENA